MTSSNLARHRLRLTVVALAMAFGSTAFGQSGPEIFTKNKCNECHSVKSAGIAKSEKKSADDDEGADSGGDKKESPDLSGVGLSRDANWMTRYLQKKEKIDGVAHRKRFKGSKEELATLTAWMETLKTKAGK